MSLKPHFVTDAGQGLRSENKDGSAGGASQQVGISCEAGGHGFRDHAFLSLKKEFEICQNFKKQML
jgi:hypothetical protein